MRKNVILISDKLIGCYSCNTYEKKAMLLMTCNIRFLNHNVILGV